MGASASSQAVAALLKLGPGSQFQLPFRLDATNRADCCPRSDTNAMQICHCNFDHTARAGAELEWTLLSPDLTAISFATPKSTRQKKLDERRLLNRRSRHDQFQSVPIVSNVSMSSAGSEQRDAFSLIGARNWKATRKDHWTCGPGRLAVALLPARNHEPFALGPLASRPRRKSLCYLALEFGRRVGTEPSSGSSNRDE